MVYESSYSNSLQHHGIKGQKWGVRRYQNVDGTLTSKGKKRYRSTGLKAAIARHQNEKVDAGFKKWKENSEKKADAIELGKKANAAQIAWEKDKSNKDLEKEYRSANKEYKKALKDNTTYRKGDIKKQVGQDIARKHLTEAKRVKKQLDADPTNKQLQKTYDELMSKHDIERASARRAPELAANRSKLKASIKRSMTMTAKAAAMTATVTVGLAATNAYLNKHDVTLNGSPIRFTNSTVDTFNSVVRLGKDLFKYI